MEAEREVADGPGAFKKKKSRTRRKRHVEANKVSNKLMKQSQWPKAVHKFPNKIEEKIMQRTRGGRKQPAIPRRPLLAQSCPWAPVKSNMTNS